MRPLIERHKDAMKKVRESVKDIPGVDYSKEMIIGPIEGVEFLGGLQYYLKSNGDKFIVSIEHIGGVNFEVVVYKYHRLRGQVKFDTGTKTTFKALRATVEKVVDFMQGFIKW